MSGGDRFGAQLHGYGSFRHDVLASDEFTALFEDANSGFGHKLVERRTRS